MCPHTFADGGHLTKHATYNEVELVVSNSENNYTKGLIGISVYQENLFILNY